jgi:hypothetical protein
MTFAAVSTIIQTTTTSLSTAPTVIGQFYIVETVCASATVYCNGMSGGNCTWVQLGSQFVGTTFAYYASTFLGTATATGAATATLTFSGTKPTTRTSGQLFSSTVGSFSLDGTVGTVDSSGTANYPSLNPAGAGELYFGFAYWDGACTNGTTTGYVYQQDAGSNGMVYNVACTSGAQAPTWGSAGASLGQAVLLKESAAAVVGGKQIFQARQAVKRAAFW